MSYLQSLDGSRRMTTVEHVTISGDYNAGSDNAFQTVSEFWDCECGTDYQHRRVDQTTCGRCNTNENEQPDSRLNELVYHNPTIEFEPKRIV